MNKFQQTTPQAQSVAPAPPPSYSEKSFLWSWVSGAGLPLMQAVITGIIAMVLTAALIYAFDGGSYIKPMIVIGALASSATWFVGMRRWSRLTRALEPILNIDLDGDRQIGEPKRVRIQIDEVTGTGSIRQAKMIDLPISEEKLIPLAKSLLAGRPFSEREWAGAGKLLSSGEFRELRTAMIKAGLLRAASEKDSRQGYVLTLHGEMLMKTYAGLLSPTLAEEIEE